ncbi:phosphodiester glycosidase family protein [Streptomyces sp. NPDC048462]|uniref:phosphodiester glycosidase family protein n=1 Tax=Streptomyces sp. NPDC048462 TaxID=3365555 RepID=UPI003718C680
MNRWWPVRGLAVSLALLVTSCTTQAGGGPDGAGARPQSPLPGSSRPADRLPVGVSFDQSVRRLADGSPVRVGVLTVAQGADADVEAGHGGAVATTATVRELARRAGAAAAVNGTYFDTDSPLYKGDPLGLYVSRGALLSESVGERTTLVLPGQGLRPYITELRSSTSVTSSDGASAVVDGTDRTPGRILGCGGVGGDRLASTGAKTVAPLPGQVCVDPDEIVDFPAQWGVATPAAGPGSVEVRLDARSVVTGVQSPSGGRVPPAGRTLVGTGTGAAWLRRHATPGRTLTVASRLTDAEGRQVDLAHASLLGAGPALVRSGRAWINTTANGVSAAAARTRSPRTVAGIRPDGTLLLVVLDGRRPGVSEGASLAEAAAILLSLGAEDAMNLDGGGSSTMVVLDRVRNSPTDHGRTADARQRKVSNAIVVVPRRDR